MSTETYVVYECIPHTGHLPERHEIARVNEEQMPLKQTKAYALARGYAHATGRNVQIDPWIHVELDPVKPILGYRFGGELVCVECGLKRLDPQRVAVIDYLRNGRIESVQSTNGLRLACHDCRQEIFSPKVPFPTRRDVGGNSSDKGYGCQSIRVATNATGRAPGYP